MRCMIHTVANCRSAAGPKVVVTKRIPQPRSELSAEIRTHEAKLLATMLRTSRLTFVFGEPGTETTTLLKTGVMPLLQPRFADKATLPGADEPALMGTDRRRAAAGGLSPRRVEAAIYVDAWGEDPLADLKARIGDIAPATARNGLAPAARLADTLQQLNQRSGLQIVFLLDRFEEFLAAPADHEGVTRFWSELVEAIQLPKLPANFLIALDEGARPGLERLRRVLPGFDHNSLRLSPIAAPGPPQPPTLPMSSAVSLAGAENSVAAGQDAGGAALPVPQASAKPRRRGPPPREPIKVEDVYAFIEATLSRTAVQSAEGGGCDQPRDRRAPRG